MYLYDLYKKNLPNNERFFFIYPLINLFCLVEGEMKRQIFVLVLMIIMFSANCFAQQYGWVQLPSPVSGNLRNIYVSGSKTWLNNGYSIYYSNNYPSEQLELIYNANGFGLYDMIIQCYGNNIYGWAVGSSSMGARTTDGINWTSMSLGGTSTYTCVTFPTLLKGFASGTDKRLHKTVNGGINWIDAGVTLGFSTVSTLVFPDSLIGYVGTPDPRLAKSVDGGIIWVDEEADFAGGINDIFFYDNNNGWAIGRYDILRYNNGVWNQISNPTEHDLNTVFFINPNEGWIVGNEGTILHSIDGGENWSLQNSSSSSTLLDIFFTSPTNGYAVGTEGSILHYTLINSTDNPSITPKLMTLKQNYPNPFNPQTTLYYTLNLTSHVNLSVYNLQGKRISQLVDCDQNSGEHSVIFDAQDLPSGIYFYQLRCGDQLETRKMILLK